MAQLKKVVEPFGEVNVYPAAAGKTRVTATILMEPHREGTQTGIALDGSGSMAKLYGVAEAGGILSAIFGGPKPGRNDITPVAQKLCAYLARKIDSDGGTTCIYWAVGPGGGSVEVIGDLTADQAEKHTFGPPREFGTGTQLLPAVRYFVERFKDAPWGFYVFITDGELHDERAVIDYSKQLAREIAAGRRRPLKFVLIGIGPDVNEAQMEALDDLDTGTPIDLWDHKLAAEMRVLQEIFAEVVEKNARVAERGRVVDPQGRTLRDYSDTGLPPFLEFEAPAGTPYFTLEVNGNRIHQALSDQARVPASEIATGDAVASAPAVSSTSAPTKAPVVAEKSEDPQDFPNVLPVEPEAAPGLASTTPESVEDETWKGIDLEFSKDKQDVDLKHDGDK